MSILCLRNFLFVLLLVASESAPQKTGQGTKESPWSLFQANPTKNMTISGQLNILGWIFQAGWQWLLQPRTAPVENLVHQVVGALSKFHYFAIFIEKPNIVGTFCEIWHLSILAQRKLNLNCSWGILHSWLFRLLPSGGLVLLQRWDPLRWKCWLLSLGSSRCLQQIHSSTPNL